MTPVELKKKIYKESKTSAQTYKDEDMIDDINDAFEEIAEAIMVNSDEHFYDVPAILSLVKGVREVQLPDDIFGTVSSVQLNLNGIVVPATPIPIPPNIDLTDEKVIESLYNNGDPKYFYRRDSIFILSGPFESAEHGIYITYSVNPYRLTSLAATNDLSRPINSIDIGIPKKFHKLIPYMVSLKYKNRNSIPLNDNEKSVYSELQTLADSYSRKDKRMELKFEVQDYTDNGFNL